MIEVQVPETRLEAAFAKTLLIVFPSVFIVVIATNATRISNRAYSVRSCPASSRYNLCMSFFTSPSLWFDRMKWEPSTNPQLRGHLA
jgi:hypothetical protein